MVWVLQTYITHEPLPIPMDLRQKTIQKWTNGNVTSIFPGHQSPTPLMSFFWNPGSEHQQALLQIQQNNPHQISKASTCRLISVMPCGRLWAINFVSPQVFFFRFFGGSLVNNRKIRELQAPKPKPWSDLKNLGGEKNWSFLSIYLSLTNGSCWKEGHIWFQLFLISIVAFRWVHCGIWLCVFSDSDTKALEFLAWP